MAGELPAWHRIPWRSDSTLLDGCHVGLDLSKGFFDAGDHMKFTYPMAFAINTLAWGMIEFSTGYKLAGEYENSLRIIRWGLEWLQNAQVRNLNISYLDLILRLTSNLYLDVSHPDEFLILIIKKRYFEVRRSRTDKSLRCLSLMSLRCRVVLKLFNLEVIEYNLYYISLLSRPYCEQKYIPFFEK